MKKLFTLTTLILLTLLFNACGEKSKENNETTKVKPSADNYLDSRVNALNMAKESAKNTNEDVKKQNEMMEKLLK